MNIKDSTVYADDATESVSFLLRLRLPWLIVGLVGGLAASQLVARFEGTLTQFISLTFFLPLIVYMSSAVGTQTATIYVRNSAKKKTNLGQYLMKELLVGALLAAIFGVLLWGFSYLWLKDPLVSLTVGLAMFINVLISPLVAVLVPAIILKEHADPALGSGPFGTIISDIVSLSVYFTVASFILF